MVSKIYKTQIPAVLTYTPPRTQAKNPDGTAKYDANNQRVYEPGGGQPQTLEVHLTLEGRGTEAERPGANANEAYYEGQVVKTPGSSLLELPAGIKEFALTVDSVPGMLRVRPVVVDQHAIERRKLGAVFKAVWSS